MASTRLSARALLIAVACAAALGALSLPELLRSRSVDPPTSAEPGEARPRPAGRLARLVVAPADNDPGTLLPEIFRITDVAVGPEGWAVLDGPGARVVTVDSLGRVGPGRGRAGRGPGELAGPAEVALRGDEVAVLDKAALHLDILGASGGERVTLPVRGCATALADDLAADGRGWLVLRRCLTPNRMLLELLRIRPDGGATVLDTATLGPMRVADPFLRPVLAVSGPGVYLGTTRAPCLRRASRSGPLSICPPAWTAAAIPDSLRDALEAAMPARGRALGLRVQVPEHFPPFVAVRALDERLAVRRPRGDGTARWVLSSADASLDLQAEEGVRVEPGPRGLLLLRQEMAGVRVWTVPLPSSTGGA